MEVSKRRTGKLSRRLVLAFVAIALIGTIANTITTIYSSLSANGYVAVVENYGFSQGYIGRAMMALTDTRSYLRDMLSAKDDAAIAKQEALLAEARSRHDQYAVLADATVTDEAEMAILLRLKEGVAEYYAVQDEWVAKLKSTPVGSREALRPQLNAVIDPMYEDLFAVHGELLDSKVNVGISEVDALSASASRAFIIGGFISLFAFGVAVLVGILIARRITGPVHKLVECSEMLRAGELDFELEVDSSDELGILADTFTEMSMTFSKVIDDLAVCLTEFSKGNFNCSSGVPELYVGEFGTLLSTLETIKASLSDTLAQINIAAEQVSAGSDQVSSGAQALSQGATEQAASVEELAATINEINTRVHQTGERAVAASGKTHEAGQLMMQCDSQMQEMVKAMDEISHTSEEIGKIIKTIEDIAFQTNILALNAAVEAARAGSAGKGFAVVADEVRNLAAKSAEASQNTAGLIEAAMAAVANGAKIANSTAEQLQLVAGKAQEVSEMVDGISTAAQEQSDAVGQIATGVDQISAVVQTNSATAEQSAAASQELSGQSSLLKGLVDQFQLKTV